MGLDHYFTSCLVVDELNASEFEMVHSSMEHYRDIAVWGYAGDLDLCVYDMVGIHAFTFILLNCI